jgi:LemA protein
VDAGLPRARARVPPEDSTGNRHLEGAMETVLIAAVVGIIVAALVAYGIALYNSLVEVRNNVDKAWKNIDVLLQQRHDELPKLVDATKGYLQHERALLERLTHLRTGYDQAASTDEKTRVENEINRQMGRLRVAWEAYPDLKSSPLFAQVLSRISALESSVADRRELFNDSVNIYNIRIARFPELVLAGGLGYARHAFLEVPEDRKADVTPGFA